MLTDLLSSRVRAVLLSWLAPRLDAGYSLTELSHATGLAVSSLQHECYKLERIGVLHSHRVGQSRLYRVCLENHAARAIVALVIAVLGLERVLGEAASGEGTFSTIALATSVATARRPILILIGNAGLESLDRITRRSELVLGQPPGSVELAYVNTVDDDAVALAIDRLMARLGGHAVHPITGTWPPEIVSAADTSVEFNLPDPSER